MKIIIFTFVVPKHTEYIRLFLQLGIQHESINITAIPRLRVMLFYRYNNYVRCIDIRNNLQLILVWNATEGALYCGICNSSCTKASCIAWIGPIRVLIRNILEGNLFDNSDILLDPVHNTIPIDNKYCLLVSVASKRFLSLYDLSPFMSPFCYSNWDFIAIIREFTTISSISHHFVGMNKQNNYSLS